MAATRGGPGSPAAIIRRWRSACARQRPRPSASGRGGTRGRGSYLAAIDGMVWGDGPAQGFVRGRTFVHPDLRFAFDVPAGYTLSNEPDVIAANGPREAMLLVDSVNDPGGDPAAYLARGWAPEIAAGVAAGPLTDLRSLRVNGLDAAQARAALASGGSRRVADLTVIRFRGQLYRLTGLHEPDDRAGAARARRGGRELPAALARRGGADPAAAHPHPPHRAAATTSRRWPRRCRSGRGRGRSST